MGTVVPLNNITLLDLPADRILTQATEAGLESAIVIGWKTDENGGEFYFASSIAAGPEVLWLMALAKKRLLEIGDPE